MRTSRCWPPTWRRSAGSPPTSSTRSTTPWWSAATWWSGARSSSSLLTGGTALVEDVDQLLTKNERALVRVIRRGAIVTDAVYDGRTGLRSGLLSVIAVSNKFPTLGTGGKLRVKGRLIQQTYREYTAADCPRYGRARGDNCPGSGRAAVGSLVGGGLTAGQGTGRGERR